MFLGNSGSFSFRLLSNLGLILAMGFSSADCARKRPVERVKETEGNRWAKASFDTGKNWLGKVTIVNNGSNSAFGFVGLQSSTYLGQFRFTKDHLQFVDTSDVFKSKAGPEKIINEWSIEHSDYHQKVSGGRVSNVESENDQIAYDQKRFFRVNWDSAVISEAATFPFSIDDSCWAKKTSRMVDYSQEIEANYVGFIVAVDYQVNENCITAPQYYREDFTHTIHYKYSFKQDDSEGYKSYVYTGEDDPLMKKYGYFQTITPFINGATGLLENSFLMNRWHPKKTHTIYFSENFPEKYKWIYNDPDKGIMAQTNKIFETANLPIRFQIKENDGSKRFGDIRYSFIHFIEDMDYQAPFGYGPSDANPVTGEIIASNTVIWTSQMQAYLKRLKEFDARQPTRPLTSSIYREIKNTMAQDSANWTQTSSFLTVADLANYYRYLLPEFTFGNAGNAFAQHEAERSMLTTDARLKQVKAQVAQNSPEIDKILLETEKITSRYIEEEKAKTNFQKMQKMSLVWNFSDEMFVGLPAALQGQDLDQVTKDILYRVAIHEFGHNLNLRHNFYGTTDAGISRATEKDPKRLVTSSVMDYVELKDEIGLHYDWEAYDKAALIYAYSDGLLDPAKDAIPRLYCSDEHVSVNPLCNRFDRGSSPSEILVSMIQSYDEAYWIRNFRYSRAFWNTDNYAWSTFRTMLDVKRFVSLYRLTFQQSQIQAELANIPGLNPFVPQLISDAIANDLRQAAKLSASFLRAVMNQSFLDRPYFSSYEDFNGALTRQGISYDKVFAARFLMGDDPFPLNPNNGFGPVSFIPLRDDPLIGTFIDNILSDAYINSGDMYSGYDNLERTYFAINAASNFDFGGGRVAIDLVRIACFKKASFEASFGIDADTAGPGGTALQAGSFTYTAGTNTDPYFADETAANVILLNGDYFVAGTTKNPYGAALIANTDVAGVLNSQRNFYLITEGRVPECR